MYRVQRLTSFEMDHFGKSDDNAIFIVLYNFVTNPFVQAILMFSNMYQTDFLKTNLTKFAVI